MTYAEAAEKRIKRDYKQSVAQIEHEYIEVDNPGMVPKNRKKGIITRFDAADKLKELDAEEVTIQYTENGPDSYERETFATTLDRQRCLYQLIDYICDDKLQKFGELKKSNDLMEYVLDFGDGISYEIYFLRGDSND